MDKETSKQMSRGEAMKQMTDHTGWGYARQMLMDKLMDYQSVRNIDSESPEEAVRQIAVRQQVCDVVLSWLQEVEGEVEQHASNVGLMTDDDKIIQRYSEPDEE